MRRSRVFVMVVIGLVAAAAVSANVAQAVSSNVVISEFRVRGPNGGSDEFIELYNLSSTAVNIGGWLVRGSNSSGTVSTRATIPSGVTLSPGCHYLLTNSSTSGGPYSGSVAGDQTYSTGITDDGGIAITLADTTIVDQVGMSTGSAFKEGTPLASLGTSNLNRGYERKPGGTAGSGTDTDNNSSDFQLITPSDPQNLASPCTTIAVPTSPTGVGAASPDPVTAGSSTLLTVTVTPGTNPTSTGLAVTAGLSAIGGSAARAFFDDGTNGDVTAGDNVFSFLAAVPGATASGGKTLPVTITDAQARSGSTTIPLTVHAVDACDLSFTPVYAIQGSGPAAAITGNVTTKGVVVGDFEGSSGLGGFYLQDLTGDGDAATSDGIFVFTGSSDLVSEGQVVRVTGFARERFSQTSLNGSNSNSSAVPAANIVQCGTGSIAATDVTLPFADANVPERYEGMAVRFPQSLVISEYFNYDRFGEVVLALPLPGETRPFTGTAIDEPGAPALARTLANTLSRITLDDAVSVQNPSVLRHPNGSPFSLVNRFRGGDTVANTVGVLGFDFSLYRIFPTAAASYTSVNPRPASPDPVGGNLRVAAMNTLNFFVTLDYPTGNPLDNKCGPLLNVECRGADADQPDEFTRQRDKLLAALAGIDADIVGLNELENTTGVEPLASIVSGLPGYAYVDTGTIGVDAIKVGLIYKPAKVTPAGDFEILDAGDDPRFLDALNRPALAQTFDDKATGARFTVVVNHLKSKGSDCNAVGDPDTGDGQGNCNQTRKAAAQALVDWLATDPTGSDDPDFLIMGDLNSYATEHPIDAIRAGADDTPGTGDDYTNLIAQYQGTYAYSFVFDGQFGYLDHALASSSLAAQTTAATEWHINADEPDVLDYDTSFKPPAQDALYEPNAYRSSDHDPVIVGLNLAPEDTTLEITGTFYDSNGAPTPLTAKLSGGSACDVSGRTIAFYVDLNEDGSFTDAPDELVGSGTTNTSGNAQVSWSNSSTPAWTTGIWDIQAAFAGGPNCDPADDTSTIAVVEPGDAANGGGWYQYKTTGSPRVNFAFTVKKERDGSYRGQLLWHNNEKWRLKGTLTSFGKTAPCTYGGTSGLKCGSAQGTGKLYRWNAGTLTWDHVQDVSFVVNFVDGGSSKKGGTKPDFFGINVTDFADPALPESAPQQLKGGNVHIP